MPPWRSGHLPNRYLSLDISIKSERDIKKKKKPWLESKKCVTEKKGGAAEGVGPIAEGLKNQTRWRPGYNWQSNVRW